MRTTLTLDADVAARLKARTRKTGRSFRDVVNEALRRGLEPEAGRGRRERFAVQARDLGRVAPGVTLDNIEQLLEQLEGPLHR